MVAEETVRLSQAGAYCPLVDSGSVGPVSFKAAVPSLFGTRDRFRGRQFFHGRDGGDCAGDTASDGERL